MAQRRALTDHPLFVPMLATWFAALFSLAIAVLPDGTRDQALGLFGLGGLSPVGAIGAGAMVGLLTGLGVGKLAALAVTRRGARDPRPVYTDPVYPGSDSAAGYRDPGQPARRPLHVHEEVSDDAAIAPARSYSERRSEPQSNEGPGPGPEAGPGPGPGPGPEPGPEPERTGAAVFADAGDGFLILGSQSAQAARAAPDLQGLLDQFDTALEAFRSPESPPPLATQGPDPVHAFVARQTGTTAPATATATATARATASAPASGPASTPDRRSDLRATLDKLARFRRRD